MNKYTKLKEKHQKEVNEFPMMFAFDLEQFDRGMKKLGAASKEEIMSIGYGGYIRKADKEAYIQMHQRINDEEKEAMQDPEYCYEMFRYELSNHEYCITYDYTDTLETLGLTEEEVVENPVWFEALKRAERDYLRSVK